jgi:hypothetical protein
MTEIVNRGTLYRLQRNILLQQLFYTHETTSLTSREVCEMFVFHSKLANKIFSFTRVQMSE